MDQTFQALGGILLKAIPTALIFILFFFYLKVMLFGPLRKVLKRRDELTIGARKAAEASLVAAERKAAEFEAKLREARGELYKEQEATRKRWMEEQAAQVASARLESEKSVQAAKAGILEDAAAAKATLQTTASELADSIVAAVLKGGAR